MRWYPVRVKRSVDRGRAGMAIELRNHLIRVADLVIWWGRQYGASRKSRVMHWTCGVKDPEHVRKLFERKPGDPKSDQRCRSWSGRRRCIPNVRHERSWEVGLGHSICEASEQRYSTRNVGQLPAEFVEKRPWAKGNSGQTTVTSTQRLEATSSVLDRIREAELK